VGVFSARIEGREEIAQVVFGESETPILLGAVTLQQFGLEVDTVNEQLLPTHAYLLAANGP
jgi:hypothetical protein